MAQQFKGDNPQQFSHIRISKDTSQRASDVGKQSLGHSKSKLDVSRQLSKEAEAKEAKPSREILAQAAEARRRSRSLDEATYQSILRQNQHKASDFQKKKAEQDTLPQVIRTNNHEIDSTYTGKQAIEQIQALEKTGEPVYAFSKEGIIYATNNINYAEEKFGKEAIANLKEPGDYFERIRLIELDDAKNQIQNYGLELKTDFYFPQTESISNAKEANNANDIHPIQMESNRHEQNSSENIYNAHTAYPEHISDAFPIDRDSHLASQYNTSEYIYNASPIDNHLLPQYTRPHSPDIYDASPVDSHLPPQYTEEDIYDASPVDSQHPPQYTVSHSSKYIYDAYPVNSQHPPQYTEEDIYDAHQVNGHHHPTEHIEQGPQEIYAAPKTPDFRDPAREIQENFIKEVEKASPKYAEQIKNARLDQVHPTNWEFEMRIVIRTSHINDINDILDSMPRGENRAPLLDRASMTQDIVRRSQIDFVTNAIHEIPTREGRKSLLDKMPTKLIEDIHTHLINKVKNSQEYKKYIEANNLIEVANDPFRKHLKTTKEYLEAKDQFKKHLKARNDALNEHAKTSLSETGDWKDVAEHTKTVRPHEQQQNQEQYEEISNAQYDTYLHRLVKVLQDRAAWQEQWTQATEQRARREINVPQVESQAPGKQRPNRVEIPKQETQESSPTKLQETQESSPEAQSETSTVHSEHSHISDIDYDGATSYEEDSTFPEIKKKKKKELSLFPEKSKEALFDAPIITDDNKKRQTTQETERIRQEQADEAQEEYFQKKKIQEYNDLCEAQVNADLQATLAKFYEQYAREMHEQRTREMRELDAQNRQMHFDTRPEILGY